MPTTGFYSAQWMPDWPKIEAYLRSRGLVPRTGKWDEVRSRKRFMFGHWR